MAVDPINRYNIGMYTEGLKNNTDGSLGIYIQNANPGPDPTENQTGYQQQSSFYLVLRTYEPSEQNILMEHGAHHQLSGLGNN